MPWYKDAKPHELSWAYSTRTRKNKFILHTSVGGLGAALRAWAPAQKLWSTFYVEVQDVQATLDKATSLGSKTVVPVTEIPGFGTFAMFDDPDGLLIGLTQASGSQEGGPGPSSGEGAKVDWFEVLGSDAERTQDFYKELFGWTINPDDQGYALVDTGAGRGIQGGVGSGGQERWATIYAHVPDVERSLARAEQLGGTRVYGPMAVDDHMQTGALRDPAGNVFGVYHHEDH